MIVKACIALALLFPIWGCALLPDATRTPPNVLVIVADDLGWSDIGALGGEIPTPHIDGLAKEGVLFTNFHVAATCSPTRAMLLTGLDNHRNGLGNMGEFLAQTQRGKPGYEGHLNRRGRTLAELLRDAGYATAMAGKWHLGGEPGQRPHDRGFERSFAFLEGSGDAWGDGSPAPLLGDRVRFTRDGEVVARPAGRFSAELYVSELIASFDAAAQRGQPFFGYLAFQAVHWPHHAPQADLERSRGLYDAGPRAIRDARVARQRALGLFAEGFEPAPMEDAIPAWEALPAATRRDEVARMEAYAAMAMAMDTQIGRLLEHLERGGHLDDTIVLFVSDNGADPSEPERAPGARAWYEARYPKTAPEDYGAPGSFPSTGFAWARASVAPLRLHKGQPSEGGLRVPLIARWPESLAPGTRVAEFGHVTDLVPTVLEATGVDATGVGALDGRSLWSLARGGAPERGADEAVGYELMGNAALFRGDLKLVRSHGQPWQLFDLARDPGETRDLAPRRISDLSEMLKHYNRYERAVGVVPVPADYDVMKILLRERDGEH